MKNAQVSKHLTRIYFNRKRLSEKIQFYTHNIFLPKELILFSARYLKQGQGTLVWLGTEIS